jgi:hypothetical protein
MATVTVSSPLKRYWRTTWRLLPVSACPKSICQRGSVLKGRYNYVKKTLHLKQHDGFAKIGKARQESRRGDNIMSTESRRGVASAGEWPHSAVCGIAPPVPLKFTYVIF